jgi:hypothetical protein
MILVTKKYTCDLCGLTEITKGLEKSENMVSLEMSNFEHNESLLYLDLLICNECAKKVNTSINDIKTSIIEEEKLKCKDPMNND